MKFKVRRNRKTELKKTTSLVQNKGTDNQMKVEPHNLNLPERHSPLRKGRGYSYLFSGLIQTIPEVFWVQF